MVVLMSEMSEVSGGGQKRRQCNARCHNARKPKCTCICGGRYHGAARDGTLEKRVEEFTKGLLGTETSRPVDFKKQMRLV